MRKQVLACLPILVSSAVLAQGAGAGDGGDDRFRLSRSFGTTSSFVYSLFVAAPVADIATMGWDAHPMVLGEFSIDPSWLSVWEDDMVVYRVGAQGRFASGLLLALLHRAREGDEGHGRPFRGIAHGELHRVEGPTPLRPFVQDLLDLDIGHVARLDDFVTQGHAVSPLQEASLTATSFAAYVRIMSAPARLIATSASSVALSPSIQPRSAAAWIIAYSPET